MMNGTSGSMDMTGAAGWWGLTMMLLMLVGVVLAVLGGVWLFRQVTGAHTRRAEPLTHGGSAVQDPAHRRLRERYAAGEIDDEEYERRLSALTQWH